MRTLSLRLIAMVVFTLLAPASARAQWGEPINTPGDRFIVLESYLNQAVYDKETGLVWEKSPSENLQFGSLAGRVCGLKVVGNRQGWRLPTNEELRSLIDPSRTSPALPDGHPFENIHFESIPPPFIRIDVYWTATEDSFFPGSFYRVSFFNASLANFSPKSFNDARVWCVRGGQGTPVQ